MFDEFRERGGALVDRICASNRAQAQMAAQMLTDIGDLYRLRVRENGERPTWAVDTFEEVTTEVAAALKISQGLARDHLGHARAMREKLPKTAQLFVAGDLSYYTFQIVVSRILLISDPDVMAAVDAEIAATVGRWPSLSRGQLAGRVDRIVARHDVDAVRRRKKKRFDRHIDIWDSGDGLSEIRGFLRNPDGHVLTERLDALAATVCPNDPRTPAMRRADAMGALGAGADRLACECNRPDCTAGRAPAGAVVIHVIAEQATVEGTGDTPGSFVDPDGLIPPELIAELAASATLVPLVHPGDADPECRYTPSAKLADFVRCRDMSCRFPGCDRRAPDCDIDHTVPWPTGPTHASNLKCLCRIHHLAKTFGGWRDVQYPDGRVQWTSPTGRTYITTPGAALWFPSLCRPTGRLPAVGRTRHLRADRTGAMPRRRRTRAENRARWVAEERRANRLNREADASWKRWKRALANATAGPPPF